MSRIDEALRRAAAAPKLAAANGQIAERSAERMNRSGLEHYPREDRRLIGSTAGDEQTGNPGQEGFGNIRQGFLEASNVEPVNELIDLITTQRSFELNSQVVQAGDQIMQIVANLRRAG